jgi:NodT family efflux transporter outer membrane factor (OMF) lipoprotein
LHIEPAPPRVPAARTLRALALLGPLLLGACSLLQPVALPPAAAPFAAPADWSGGGGVATPAQATVARTSSLVGWWRQFNDPLLSDLIERALRANTSIAAAQAALQQARAQRDVAAAGLATTVVGSAQAQRSKLDGGVPVNHYNVGFDATWEPDVFGARRHAYAAGEALATASAISLADVQVSVAAEVARDYIELRGAQQRLAIAAANLDSQRRTLQITRWRTQAGLLTSLEEQQAITAAEQAAAQVPPLQASVAQLSHALAVLCGQAPAVLDAVLAAPGAIPAAVDSVGLVLVLPAQALRQRPDVRAAEYQLAAARARVGQADAARYPVFQLQGSIGLSGIGMGGSGSTLLRALLGSVAGTAFDGGANRAQVALQRGALAQSQASYQALLLAALQDVEDGLAVLDADRVRAGHLRQAVAAADHAARLASQRYASGLVDFQTVLETQRALYASQDGLASTSASLGTDMVRLYKALGGGWQARDGEAGGAAAGPDADPASGAKPSAAADATPGGIAAVNRSPS